MYDLIKRTFDHNIDELPSKTSPLIREKHFCDMDFFYMREQYIKKSFALLTKDWMKELKYVLDQIGINTTVELCSGSGWLSHWLTKYGVNITHTTDSKYWFRTGLTSYPLPIVEEMDALEAIMTYRADAYLLSWPYMDETAFNIWNSLPSATYLIYIGEDMGGCTANNDFFEAIEGHEILTLEDYVSFPQIYDRVVIYKK